MPTKYAIQPGDIVYARKKTGFLDASIVVGHIVQCQRSQGNPLVWDVKVVPAANVKTLENVTVVVITEQTQLKTAQTLQTDLINEKETITK